MIPKSLRKCAETLSKEIAESRTLDIPSLKIKIEQRLNDGIEEFTFDLLSEIEREKMFLKRKMLIASDTKAYQKLGLEMSILNTKTKALETHETYKAIKNFLIENHPQIFEEFKVFHQETRIKQ